MQQICDNILVLKSCSKSEGWSLDKSQYCLSSCAGLVEATLVACADSRAVFPRCIRRTKCYRLCPLVNRLCMKMWEWVSGTACRRQFGRVKKLCCTSRGPDTFVPIVTDVKWHCGIAIFALAILQELVKHITWWEVQHAQGVCSLV